MGFGGAGDGRRRTLPGRPGGHHDRRDFHGAEGVFSPYVAFFNSGFRRTVLYRTIEIALITTVISLLVGFIAAYVIAQMPGRAKSVMIIAAVFPLLTGVVVRSFAWLIILGKNGILNTMLLSVGVISEPLSMLYTEGSVIVAMVYLFVPLMILTLVGVLEGIPQDLIQAATSLGATPAATFRQVILPLATPALSSVPCWSSPAASPPMPRRSFSAAKSR